MWRASATWSGGSSGPSLRTRARIGFVSRPGSPIAHVENNPDRLAATVFDEDRLADANVSQLSG